MDCGAFLLELRLTGTPELVLDLLPMADRLTPEKRSAHMARIRRSNTRPELVVRKLLTELGYRYRIQLAGVPGRPDIAFTARRKAIFIHGCFWHAHTGCAGHHVPETRSDFWAAKFASNKARDQRLLEAAHAAGWETLVIWECELKDRQILATRLRDYLGPIRAKHNQPFSTDREITSHCVSGINSPAKVRRNSEDQG